ncbi:hypothetical protein ACHWQZ_G015916 [Mnemiopsis leidyi]
MFGQLVIGPPGSVKRDVIIVNLDPANDRPPYEADVDVQSLIEVDEVMERLTLGPNGAILFCMEYIENNMETLKEMVMSQKAYVIFDCPGQVELYTHHAAFRNIVNCISKWGMQLCVVSLVDSHYCTDPAKFISVLLTSLSSMLHLELPHINVLSKIDLIDKMGPLAFKLNFYTEVLDLSYLLSELDERVCSKRFIKLNHALTGLVEDYNLVSFYPLNVQDIGSLHRLCKAVDKANGYVYGELEERTVAGLSQSDSGVNLEFEYDKSLQYDNR